MRFVMGHKGYVDLRIHHGRCHGGFGECRRNICFVTHANVDVTLRESFCGVVRYHELYLRLSFGVYDVFGYVGNASCEIEGGVVYSAPRVVGVRAYGIHDGVASAERLR